jgi:HEAT repeat protein
MTLSHTRVCALVSAGALFVATSAAAQGADAPHAAVRETPSATYTVPSPAALTTMAAAAVDAVRGLDLNSLKGLDLNSLKGLDFDSLKGLDFDNLKALDFDDLTGWDGAQERDRAADRSRVDAEERDRERETRAYEQARELMDQAKYDRAIERFSEVAAMNGSRADAALYWKAWAQNKVGQRADALTTLAALTRDHAQSRYLAQARQLDAEVRRDSGQPARPSSESDDDLKLLAINALLESDADQAIPFLQKMLDGTAAPKLKSRALFVLAQSNSPRAREVLKGVAKGSSTPELQNRAIDYLGQMGGAESRTVLAEIYAGTADVDVKRRILRAFMIGGEKGRLLTAAQTEQNADLRGEAVQQLGVMGAHDELWQLYQKESSTAVKKRIIQAMFVGGDSARLLELARTEQDLELRRTAVRNLGVMDASRTGGPLVEIYNTDKDPSIRKAALQGLFQQGNATALVDLARKEQDPAMKRDIVQQLSVMGGNPAATAYMMELLNGK